MTSTSSIIRRHGLKAGDTMRDAAGDPIDGSAVIGRSAWAMLTDDRCIIERHGVVSDEVSRVTLDRDGFSALASLLGGDEVHTALADGSTISHHRTVDGAIRAATGHMAERMSRLGSSTLTDEDLDLLATALRKRRGLDLQIRRDLGSAVPGMSVDRVHAIAMAVSSDYSIRSSALLD